MFAETKEGICRNKDLKKLTLKIQEERELRCRTRNLKLTLSIHFEMILFYVRRRIIGLLQSQDLDGKPTFEFIVTGWPVNELFCLKAPRGGIVLVVEDDRVL